jgi:hypothetical protein
MDLKESTLERDCEVMKTGFFLHISTLVCAIDTRKTKVFLFDYEKKIPFPDIKDGTWSFHIGHNGWEWNKAQLKTHPLQQIPVMKNELNLELGLMMWKSDQQPELCRQDFNRAARYTPRLPNGKVYVPMGW